MSTKWTLGSFIPNPVTADIVSFLELDDKLTFALSSPLANDIVYRYRFWKNTDARAIQFYSDDDNNLIVSMDYKREFNTSEKCGSQKAEAFIVRLLGMCGSISNLVWGRDKSFKCVLNAKIYNKLRTLPLREILISGNVDLTADQLMELRSKVGSLSLFECQVSRDLVTDEIFQKLCEDGFYQDVTPALSNTGNSTLVQTTVSDRFLDSLNSLINSSRYIIVRFGNFHTKFTTEGIKRVIMAFPNANFNFGILDKCQTESAHAFLMEMRNPMWGLESQLLIIDNQYFIRYESIGKGSSRSFILSLSIPSNFSSTSAPNIDEELDVKSRILTSLFLSDNAKLPESKEFRICCQMWNNSSSIFFIFEIVFNNSYRRSFVLTDIDQKTALKVIKTCLDECENVDKIDWNELDFNDDAYEILKTVSDKIVRFEWSQTTLSAHNLVEFFLKYPRTAGKCLEKVKRFQKPLPAEYLTNEIVCALVLNEVDINVIWTGEKNEAVTTLTDQLLIMLAERNSSSAIRLSIIGYRTGFTIQGIETLTPQLAVIGSIDPSKLSFTLNDSEEVKAVRFLSSIQLNPETIWRIVTTSWDDGFLQSFKVASDVHGEICIQVDFDGSKKTVDKEDHLLENEERITESNYQKLLASGDYNIVEMEYFLNSNLKRLDLLDLMIIIYDYHLYSVKAKIRRYLKKLDSDFLFDDRFFSLPSDQQAFVLNMIYSPLSNYCIHSNYSDYLLKIPLQLLIVHVLYITIVLILKSMFS